MAAAALHLLDTNTASFIIRGDARLLGRLQVLPVTAVAISCVTEAELLYGLARKPDAKALANAVTAFLRHVQACHGTARRPHRTARCGTCWKPAERRWAAWTP